MNRAVKVLMLKIQTLADLGQTEITLPAELFDMLPKTYRNNAPLTISRAFAPTQAAMSMIPTGAGADAANVGGPVLSSSGGDA